MLKKATLILLLFQIFFIIKSLSLLISNFLRIFVIIRRTPNILWFLMGTIGAILLVVQYFTTGFENILYFYSKNTYI